MFDEIISLIEAQLVTEAAEFSRVISGCVWVRYDSQVPEETQEQIRTYLGRNTYPAIDFHVTQDVLKQTRFTRITIYFNVDAEVEHIKRQIHWRLMSEWERFQTWNETKTEDRPTRLRIRLDWHSSLKAQTMIKEYYCAQGWPRVEHEVLPVGNSPRYQYTFRMEGPELRRVYHEFGPESFIALVSH